MPPKWFDDDYYAGQKVIQMNNMGYEPEWLAAHGAKEWNEPLYRQYLAEYRMPDGSPVTAYENFLACNGCDYVPGIRECDVNVSCTPLFDVRTYAMNLAAWANGPGQYAAAGIRPGEWTAENIKSHVFNDLRMSLWEHYKDTGMLHAINPSDEFDTAAYLQAVGRDWANEGKTAHSVQDVIAEFKSNGLNPVMHHLETTRG